MKTLHDLTATELLAKIKAREISIREIAEAVIKRHEQVKDLNAVIDFDQDKLLAQAVNLDQQLSNGNVSPLMGVPFIIKDNINTRDFPTTGGTPALKDNRPDANAAVVQRLIDAGSLIAGKANLHELAFGITNNNACLGPARNPYNRELIPGGSSGGTAVAIASRIVPAGLGTDTGGSSRIPAALCGICGFRPSTGRYPDQGLIKLSNTRDTVGAMARSVDDIKLIDSVLAGRKQNGEIKPEQIRIGIPRRPFFDRLEEDVAVIMEETLELLARHGMTLVEDDLDIEELREKTSFTIALYETKRELTTYVETMHNPITLATLIENVASHDVKVILESLSGDSAVSEQAYQQAVTELRPALQNAYQDYFVRNNVDAIVFPTTPLTARPIGQDETVELNGKQVPTFPVYIKNSDASSIAGIPSLSIPAGLSKTGLPVGISIDGPRMTDDRVLQIGAMIQKILPVLPKPAC